jgi:magnesium transporter
MAGTSASYAPYMAREWWGGSRILGCEDAYTPSHPKIREPYHGNSPRNGLQNQKTLLYSLLIMIRSIYFASTTTSPQFNLPPAEILTALANQDGLLWLSLEKPSREEADQILSGIFNFHPLAIEDCLNEGYQTPKIDDFSTYLFLVTHAMPVDGSHSLDKTLELNIFLGANFLVTCHKVEKMAPIDEVWQRINQDDRLIRNGSDFLCHAVLDHLVDEYFPLIDRMDDEIENLEDRVLQKPDPNILARILELKHDILFLRRMISPQREVMNRISRDDFPMIDAQSRIYYRDIYDHLVRIQDLIESLRDIISGVLDIYLNSTSLRLNEIMKALTIVSTIFLPLSFIAGIYGMNFQFMPEIYWRFGYLFVWIIFVAVFSGMLIFFKRRNWF